MCENTEELVVSLHPWTKTTELIDKFVQFSRLAITDNKCNKCPRMVFRNGINFFKEGGKRRDISYNFVVEYDQLIPCEFDSRTIFRSEYIPQAGKITFTAFKQEYLTGRFYVIHEEEPEWRTKGWAKQYNDLIRHLSSEINDEIIELYKEADEFFRFESPFLLKAQETKRAYGKTNNYFIVGVYISEKYDCYFPEERYKILEIEVYGRKNGRYKLYVYKSLLMYINKSNYGWEEHDLLETFFLFSSNKKRSVKIHFSEKEQNFYMALEEYERCKDWILESRNLIR